MDVLRHNANVATLRVGEGALHHVHVCKRTDKDAEAADDEVIAASTLMGAATVCAAAPHPFG